MRNNSFERIVLDCYMNMINENNITLPMSMVSNIVSFVKS
jgi:hypothetical protein